MEDRKVFLICNAHLDPMWLWEWEEGAAAAVSTFRSAANLAEETDGFVFNHNEALLYRWVEEYEPELFERIKKLVKAGKWIIIGGWELQPDCNMPSGEGFVRQVAVGNAYFKEKFGVECKTAVNFDSFGHTRGLVQILKKCGYENYLICRPTHHNADFPVEFVWEGYEGSEVFVRRHYELYNSPLGKATEKFAYLMKERQENPLCILWGVGNHGGGPSRKDLADIAQMQKELAAQGVELIHASPDEYFDYVREVNQKEGREVPRITCELGPVSVGCYTSQVRIKQLYRRLENQLFLTEKMVSAAYLKGLLSEYPAELKEAERDMLFMQFHDILPGSGIKEVEEAGIRIAQHGLEICSRLRARAFFAHAKNVGYQANGNYPILVYNPHPTEVETVVDCQFQLQDQNWGDTFTLMDVYCGDELIPSQIEKESCNLDLDWRKRIIFKAKLKPMQMTLFECRPRVVNEQFKSIFPLSDYTVEGENYRFTIGKESGFVKSLTYKGKELLSEEGFVPYVFTDSPDSWGNTVKKGEPLGVRIEPFRLLTEEESTEYSGLKNPCPAVRVIESGPVRDVVECVYGYKTSRLVQRFFLYKQADRIDLQIITHFQEKDRLLKLFIPFTDGQFVGQKAYGSEELYMNGWETVYQKWCGMEGEHNLYLLNKGTYAANYDGGICLTLLRTPAHASDCVQNIGFVREGRYTDRIDLGEREFFVSLRMGITRTQADSEALFYNEQPFSLSFFPSGEGTDSAFIEIDDKEIQMTSFKKRDFADDFMMRLYNPSKERKTFTVRVPSFNAEEKITLGGYEVNAYILEKGKLTLTNLRG